MSEFKNWPSVNHDGVGAVIKVSEPSIALIQISAVKVVVEDQSWLNRWNDEKVKKLFAGQRYDIQVE